MIELVLAFLVAVGVLDSRTADGPVRAPDPEPPTYAELRCFLGCPGQCLWPQEPRP
jgi:hypothetical protein